MYIVDAHCDSIQQVDSGTFGIVNPYNYSQRFPQLQFVAMFCSSHKNSVQESWHQTVRYTGHFCIAMESEADRVVQVKTYADIEHAFSQGKHAALLSIEGGSGVKGSTKILRDFYNIGVRVFGLAWLSNDLAKSNRLQEGEKDTGLTDIGREIIRCGNELGMIFDVSHLSDQSFWDVAVLSKKPILATHSNSRTLCPHSRNLTDEMAKEIMHQDGMIGLNLYPEFIHEEPQYRTVEKLFAHAEHLLALGGEDHIGFGCDIDGTSGLYPSPLHTESSIHDQLIDWMLAHQYSQTLVEKIAGGNFLRYLKKYLG